MKVKLVVIGDTDAAFLKEGVKLYEKRLNHYLNFETVVMPAQKDKGKNPMKEIPTNEGESLLKVLSGSSVTVLLDERGKQYDSYEFAQYMQKKMNAGLKELTFVIGGSFGFSKDVYSKGFELLSLSKMTFSHDMVRLYFMEQLYRAMTILKKESL